jgi:hypothetical protein
MKATHKALSTLIACFVILNSITAQSVSDQFPTLATIKKTAEDFGRTIQLEWNPTAPEFKIAKNHYIKVKDGVDLMIQGLESKVRNGKKIKGKDLENYLPGIQADLDKFAQYYVENSHKAGANAALSLKGLWKVIKDLGKEFATTFDSVDAWVDTQKQERIQERLGVIKETLYPYKLTSWKDLVDF